MKTFGDTELNRLSTILSSGINTHLKSISASGHSVSASALSSLGSALASQNGRNIRHVAVGGNDMKDEGVIAFCEPLLEVNGGSLESLDFTFKGITRSGAEMIGRTFGKSECLRRLDLYRNPGIGDQGLVALSESARNSGKKDTFGCFRALVHLDISDCGVGSDGMAAVVSCLTRDEGDVHKRCGPLDLQASRNPIGKNGCLHLKKLICQDGRAGSMIRSLTLQQCSIGDEGMSSLAEALMGCGCKGFKELDVADNGISQVGAKYLANALSSDSFHAHDLVKLVLATNPIGCDGVESLAKSLLENNNTNYVLKELDLSGTGCGVNGALAMLKCSKIQSLRLFNNNLSSAGFEAIAELLVGGHPTLQHLDLGGNRASESAVVAVLNAMMVKHQPDVNVLNTLEIGGNDAGELVESTLEKLKEIRPELDIARDRSNMEQPNDDSKCENS
jgi:Ran GTPase-activating protein (RanGAP) involved in mRNA processing and transport